MLFHFSFFIRLYNQCVQCNIFLLCKCFHVKKQMHDSFSETLGFPIVSFDAIFSLAFSCIKITSEEIRIMGSFLYKLFKADFLGLTSSDLTGNRG